MPSKDRINPKANAWLELVPGRSSVQERPQGTEAARRVFPRSASLVRLADRMGVPEDALLQRYPEDTLRRLKYPVMEEVEEDGTVRFLHPKGIIEGPRPLTIL